VREQVWHFAPGPTWSLEALLVFSLAYALWRALRPHALPPVWRRLRGVEVAGVALLIAVAAFAVHLAFPVGSEQFHLQLALFPST
jgi:glucan biosynthesis protein C